MLQREPVDALHHVHVAPLTPVERLRIVAFRLEMSAMDNHVHIREQWLQRGVFIREQVEDFDPFDAVARGVRLPDVDEPQVVALPERRQELACYIASGACQEDAPLCTRITRFVEGQEFSPRSGAVCPIYSQSPSSCTAGRCQGASREV